MLFPFEQHASSVQSGAREPGSTENRAVRVYAGGILAQGVEVGVSGVKASAIAAFAAELRSWRRRHGWPQVELGERIGYSASLVSGVETLAKIPTLDFAKRSDEATGAPGTFVRLHELIAREAYPSYFAPVITFEREAVRVHEWEMRVIPGLLQTGDYARAVIKAGKPQDSADAIERTVIARLERQDLLSGEHPPMLWYVLSEGVLRQAVGGPAVMAEQLDKLTELAGRQGIVIQVLPFTVADHPGTDGPIAIFEFSAAPAAAYTECKGGGRIVEAPDEVADLMTVLNMVRAAALSPRESIEFMRKIRSELHDC